MWLYDITLKEDGLFKTVGDQGDGEFETEREAYDDAKEYIKEELTKEYNKEEKDFHIETYEAIY